MCCIFNFLQYFFGFLQKAVTAFLCCVLAYAVCCVLLFAVTAGVALGYNYSVSEYMEHKDTNVSVQLQRGIFTDKGSGLSRRRSGDGEGGEIGQDMEPGYGHPKASLKSHMQQLDAAENYERKLEELTSENYQQFQPIINYGTVNLDHLSSQRQVSASTPIPVSVGFADSTTQNIAGKNESFEMMKHLVERMKGSPGKDVMTIIGEEVAKKAFEQMAQNMSNYRMPIELAMAATASSTTEELDSGLDIAPLDIDGRSSPRGQPTKELLFSENTTPASIASVTSVEIRSDTDDVSSDWKKRLYAAVARMKRKDTEVQKPTKPKEKYVQSLFQDPSFIAGLKSISLAPYSVLQNKIKDQYEGVHSFESNIRKDKREKPSNSQSGSYIQTKIESTSWRPVDSYSNLHDDDGPAPSDEEYDNEEDEKPGRISVRRKRNARSMLSKWFSESRIGTTLINAT